MSHIALSRHRTRLCQANLNLALIVCSNDIRAISE